MNLKILEYNIECSSIQIKINKKSEISRAASNSMFDRYTGAYLYKSLRLRSD